MPSPVGLTPRLRFGVALTFVLTATVARLLLDPVLKDSLPFAFFSLAVVFTACYAGFRPALVVLVLGSLSGAGFLGAHNCFTNHPTESYAELVVYLLVSLMCAWLCGTLRARLSRAEARSDPTGQELQANRPYHQFLVLLAHQLRSFLAPIYNTVEILRRLRPTDERCRWSREVLDRQMQHLSRLVDNLLELEIHRGTFEGFGDEPGTFAVPQPTGNDLASPHPGEENRGPEEDGPARRILVVDDSADHADSLALVLQLNGHDVRTAYDGPTALAEAEAWRPDVVLLNPHLPRLSGLEVARRLRADLNRQVLLVAMSGYTQAEERRRTQEAGFHAHLIKPVKLHLLRALLAEPLPPGS